MTVYRLEHEALVQRVKRAEERLERLEELVRTIRDRGTVEPPVPGQAPALLMPKLPATQTWSDRG